MAAPVAPMCFESCSNPSIIKLSPLTIGPTAIAKFPIRTVNLSIAVEASLVLCSSSSSVMPACNNCAAVCLISSLVVPKSLFASISEIFNASAISRLSCRSMSSKLLPESLKASWRSSTLSFSSAFKREYVSRRFPPRTIFKRPAAAAAFSNVSYCEVI